MTMNSPLPHSDPTHQVLRTIIVDDEEHIRDSLRKLIAKHCPQISIIGEAGSVSEAVTFIRQNEPDLLLLDVQLDDGSGFDLLQKFESPAFKVIFITAHNEFAIRACRVSAVDFLLKPINPEELCEAINRAQQMVHQEMQIRLEAISSHVKHGENSGKKIVIKTTENIHLIEICSITHCQSDTVYTTIYTTSDKGILTSRPIKDFDEMLAGFGFFRVHRSFLINLAHVRRFEKRDGGMVILTNDFEIPVASRKREEFFSLLNDMAR